MVFCDQDWTSTAKNYWWEKLTVEKLKAIIIHLIWHSSAVLNQRAAWCSLAAARKNCKYNTFNLSQRFILFLSLQFLAGITIISFQLLIVQKWVSHRTACASQCQKEKTRLNPQLSVILLHLFLPTQTSFFRSKTTWSHSVAILNGTCSSQVDLKAPLPPCQQPGECSVARSC